MTSLPFSNTLSATAKAATHRPDRRHREGWGFRQRKTERVEIVREAWCGFGMSSEVVQCFPINLRDPLFNGSSPRLKKRKRGGWKEKQWQTVITKATTVWFCDGSLGENQWIVRSGWATCCVVTKIWSASMNLFMFKKNPIIIFLLSSNSRSGYRISYQIGFFFLPNDTLIYVQIDRCSNWCSCVKAIET